MARKQHEETYAKIKEIKKFVYNKLRHGKVAYQVIELVEDEYHIPRETAKRIVYECNDVLKTNLDAEAKDAAHYLYKNLQTIIDESMDDGDRKNAIAAATLLAKVTRVTDDKPQVTINNYGFDFDGGGED